MLFGAYSNNDAQYDQLTGATIGEAQKVRGDLEDLRTLLRSENAPAGRIEALDRAIRFIRALR